MQPFDYVVPRDHEEASKLLAAPDGRARAMLGGTDLLIRIRAGLVRPETVVDLKKLPGMQEIRELPDGWVSLGAACTMNQVAQHSSIAQRYDLLVQACNSVASYQLRNRATVGGNCCNASPAADTAPALYCLGAWAEAFGPAGQRRIPIEDFFKGPGRTALGPAEYLTAVLLPPAKPGAYGAFNKLGRTRAGDISIACTAVYSFDETTGGPQKSNSPRAWRIALGAVGPTPMRALQAEERLGLDASPASVAAAADLAGAAAQPIDDLRASAPYRTAMIRVLTRRGIESVLQAMEAAA
jgi:aerobic carbon-monoxide dehydrogenase medium subunit